MKLSIIICLYNTKREYVKKCLSSITKSTLSKEDYEILVIDDGSTEDYSQLIEYYKPTYVKTENRGHLASRLYGLMIAKGDYVAFCDSDDTVSVNYHAPMLKKAIEENCDIVINDWAFLSERAKYICTRDTTIKGDLSYSGDDVLKAFDDMITNTPEYGENGVLVVGDVAVTPMPDASQLAQIAVCTAQTAKSVAGFADPKVAMLSFSTLGSAKHEVVDKVIEATKLAKELDPTLKVEGELQADAALVPSVGQKKAPGSEIAGQANVLVFPCLEVGNIAYKLVQRLGNADAIGPILQGIARPVNDLSRGCSVDDIYKMVAITACQAMDAK